MHIISNHQLIKVIFNLNMKRQIILILNKDWINNNLDKIYNKRIILIKYLILIKIKIIMVILQI
jgi:hypothetical protein